MSPPSAPAFATDALGTRFRALLVAAGRKTSDTASGCERDHDHARGWNAAEEHAFWDQVTDDVVKDVGVAVATLGIPEQKLVDVIKVLVEDVLFAGLGVQRVARAVFQGLKVAKRWDVLRLACWDLTEVIGLRLEQMLAEVEQQAMGAEEGRDFRMMELYLRFYSAILLSYQHSGELVVQALATLERLAVLVAAHGNRAMMEEFALMCAALVHCHRGYEREALMLRKALRALREAVAFPATDACERALRDAAWILPPSQLNRYVTTVEGKWVHDEFASDHHASSAMAPQNAGSISFRKVANCMAHELTATMTNPRTKAQFQLDGALYRGISERGFLNDSTHELEHEAYALEGHWCQLLEPSGDTGATPGATSATPTVTVVTTERRDPWNCPACTLSNAATAAKCVTCGTDAPKNESVQTTRHGNRGNNPAPFQAVCNADGSFMRVRWSRGEQHGVWLAKREPRRDGAMVFDLQQSLQESTAHAMMDSNTVPMHAFSPRGEPSRVIVLEKSPSLSTYGELKVQLWIQPVQEPSSSDLPARSQAILDTVDFSLVLLPDGRISWRVHGEPDVIEAQESLVFRRLYHVTLCLGLQGPLQLMVDGVLVAESTRATDQHRKSNKPGSQYCTIGGRLSDDTSSSMVECFHGVIMDLRFWGGGDNRVNAGHLPTTSLLDAWHVKDLLAYYPLVGDSQRLLMDASKHENHATVFAAISAASSSNPLVNFTIETGGFCPSTPVDFIPVANSFTSSIDSFDVSGAVAYASSTDSTDVPCLAIQDTGAIWHRNNVSVKDGFETTFVVDFNGATPHLADYSQQSVLALCETSYWRASPLLYEASQLSFGQQSPLTDATGSNGYRGTALFVLWDSVPDTVDVSSPGSATLTSNLIVYVWKNQQSYVVCRLGNIRTPRTIVSGSGCVTRSSLKIGYRATQQSLRIEVIESGLIVETALDLAQALELQTSSVRTGLIFPSPKRNNLESPSVLLRTWAWESVVPSPPEITGSEFACVATLNAVYPRLKISANGTVSGEEGSEATNKATVACTRSMSDGSAIEQDTYGCQTCNIIHGAGLCRICATICHSGHEIVYVGKAMTACACAMRGVGLCKCTTPVDASEIPSAASRPIASLWCCSRCTVVNPNEQRVCSVCGNAAPVVATESSVPTSSSRALVPVNSPTLPLSPASAAMLLPHEDWSCSACTFLNAADAENCVICTAARSPPTAAKASAPQIATPAPGTTSNDTSDGLITLCHAAENQVGKSTTPAAAAVQTASWTCSACTMENKATDTVCFMCSTARAVPVSAPVDDVVLAVPLATPETESVYTTVGNTDDSGHPDPPLFPSVPATPSIVPDIRVDNAHFLNEFLFKQANTSTIGEKTDASIPSLFGSSTWDTTSGSLAMVLGEKFVGQYVEGTYSEMDGYVRGVARLGSDGKWTLVGRFKKLAQSQENAVLLSWNREMTRFDGKWFRGDGSGEWKCLASPLTNDFRGLCLPGGTGNSASSGTASPFYSGLINMKENLTNVCYQNSFLQTLFVTQAFRRLILSAQLSDSIEIGQGDMLRCIQELFARLIASQRPYLDTHTLQRCLSATFQAGRQQDTSDFAHFLIDALSQGLATGVDTMGDSINGSDGITQASGIADVFGGTQATILACKTCGNKSVNREYFWELLLNMIDLRYTPITDITAISGTSAYISTPPGYERLNTDLNKDRNNAPYVYLCVKRAPEAGRHGEASGRHDISQLPITDLVIKVVGLNDATPIIEGYERVPLDLNIGGSAAVAGGKKQVYMFIRREENGSPITDLSIIYGKEPVPDGFKQINVDLNQTDGTSVFLCYRCDMPITDLKIVNTGIPGYRMVDHVLNRSREDAAKQYLAYKVGGADPCVTDLKLVKASDVLEYQESGWESLGSPSSSTDDAGLLPPDQLMVRRGHGNPIFAIDVFRAPRLVPRYNDYEVIDLYEPKSSSLTGATSDPVAELDTVSKDVAERLKGDWMAGDGIDRTRKAVRIQSVSEPMNSNAFVIHGSFENKGEISAVATSTKPWSESLGEMGSSPQRKRVLHVKGHWKSEKCKQAQLFDVEIRSAPAPSRAYVLSGTIGDGTGRAVSITGVQTSNTVNVKWPITELLVLRGDEPVPDHVEVVRETCSGKTGNLLAQTQSPQSFYLAVRREEIKSETIDDITVRRSEAGFTNYVSDICVVYGDIDPIPDGYTRVEQTVMGASANLNDGTSGVPIYICYRRADSDSEKALMDLALVWTSGPHVDKVPAGFTKLQHTPLGMAANLNQGTEGVGIYVCFAKCDPRAVVLPMDDSLNGEYEITIVPTSTSTGATAMLPIFSSLIRLTVMQRVEEPRQVEGKFGTVFHSSLPGMIRGTLYRSRLRKCCVLSGVWMMDGHNASAMIDVMAPSFPFEWTLNDAVTELDGWWSGADDMAAAVTTKAVGVVSKAASPTKPGGVASVSPGTASGDFKWTLMKDSYVRVAFKKDYGTEWKDGTLIASDRVWRHDMNSMWSRFAALRTLGGDNLLSCSVCNRKTESRTHTVVVAPPAHLILTLKRMYYDWAQQKTRKCLHDVTFPALLTLPALSADDEGALYEEGGHDEELMKSHRKRQYGLYGVLVHSGLTANSGHYYSFCRESDDSGAHQLHLQDAPRAPWIKFNDMKVERSSWAEVQRTVAHSVSDTVYLLLYKRLAYVVSDSSPADADESMVVDQVGNVAATADGLDVHEHVGEDEDEAMLLAKAMALSMSASSQQHATTISEESKQEEVGIQFDNVDNQSADSSAFGYIDHRVLSQIEKANAQFLRDTMSVAASDVHVSDLHTVVALLHNLPMDMGTTLRALELEDA